MLPTLGRSLRYASFFALLSAFAAVCLLDAASFAEKPKAAVSKQSAGTAGEQPIFEDDIIPIFKAKCLSCHNPKSRKGALDLSSIVGVVKGSESGEIVDGGKPDDSLLFQMVEEKLMPPEGKGKPLTKKEIAIIRRWIESGMKSKSGDDLAAVNRITQHNVIPIMLVRCTVCHGLRLQEGGLDLRSKATMLKGGKSGPAIVLGKPKDSLLLKRIHATEMPPPEKLVDFGIRPIDESEIEIVTKWIAQGAPEIDLQPDIATTEPDTLVTDEDRKFWSFRTPKRPHVPQVKHRQRVRNPIDAFILQKLEEEGFSLSSEAGKQTLIRRVAFDLTGLPPQWKDVEQFLADGSDDAYEKMVDRYLSSHHYGERWGRYWLDLAGYADSEGKRSADPIRPHAWRYRDYVIRAFNSDKPYDRFLLEQIAGDELADYEHVDVITQELMDNLVATGFLRMAPDGTGSDIVNTVVERMEVIADEINIFSASILGLTMKCAQCHSHKYDPIPQRDYYRLTAIFKGGYDEHDWLKPTIVKGQAKAKKAGRVLPFVTSEEKRAYEQAKQKLESQIAAAKSTLQKKQKELIAKHLADQLKKLPAELHDDLRKMLATSAKQRNDVQKYLATKFEKRLRIDANQLKKSNPDFKKLAAATDKNVKALQGKMPGEPSIRALWDRGVPSPTYLYRRGQSNNPGDLVGPGVPSVLTNGRTPFDVKPPWKGSTKTGRRLALAKWLVEPKHPLTSRVMVNRIWYHHFGRGIVKSLGNFGKTGVAPTHPELLDWLATEFIAQKWSIKEMHRLIMTSSTYRQVSGITPQLEERDPANELLSRMPLRRMEAESVRDSIIAVAGKLHDKPFGKPDGVNVRADGLVTSVPTEKGYRRSLYVRHRRKEMPTILENFDLPQMIPNCIERPGSTVASQALHLMNNEMIRSLTADFAVRVEKEVGNDRYRQVERVYQIALGRMPSDEEKELGLETLTQLTEQWKKKLANDQKAERESQDQKDPGSPETNALINYCHTIINSAAFLYID